MAEQKTVASKQEEIAWYDVIGKFRQQAQEFEKLFARLQQQKAIAAKDPKLAKEYQRVMSAGSSLQQKITQLRDATNNVLNWIKGVFGFDGLGFVPLIPIAVVAASVAAVGKWVKDAYVFSKKLDMVNKLEAKGMSTGAAVGQAERLTSSLSILGSMLGMNPKWLVVGGLVLLSAPIIFKIVKKYQE